MFVVLFEAHFVGVLVVVRLIAVRMHVRDVRMVVTGVRMRVDGPGMFVLVMVRGIMVMFVAHTFISVSLLLGVGPSSAFLGTGPSVATWSM